MTASRTIRIVLAVSLVLNVLVIGVIAGAALRWQRGDMPRWIAVRQMARLRSAADTLQPENRAAYVAALRETRRDAGPLIMASRAARREAAEAFVAPDFDRAAVAAALRRARAADFQLRERAEAAVLDVTATLPPEERRRLGEGLKRSGPLQQSAARPLRNAR